jgi:hypothetical protein
MVRRSQGYANQGCAARLPRLVGQLAFKKLAHQGTVKLRSAVSDIFAAGIGNAIRIVHIATTAIGKASPSQTCEWLGNRSYGVGGGTCRVRNKAETGIQAALSAGAWP